MSTKGQRGFSVLELLVSLSITLVITIGATQMMLHNSRINRAQQMTSQVQSNARNCLAMIVQRMRSAGWDPLNVGIPTIVPDADPDGGISEIEVFADLDSDGATNGVDEQVLIRHVNNRIVWRRYNDPNKPFVVLATSITNNEDGDGTPEAMFVPTADPDRILVRITAQSTAPDPMSGEFIRYSVSSEVFLRKST